MPMAASRRSLFPSQYCAPMPLPALREGLRSSSSMAARTSSGMFERQLGPSSTPNEPWPGVLPFAIVPLSLHDSGCVLCGLRDGRDSDGAPHNLRAGLLPCGTSCGVRLPCAFNGAFAIRKLSVRRFFPHCSVPLSCRFVFDFLSKRWVTFPRVALC